MLSETGPDGTGRDVIPQTHFTWAKFIDVDNRLRPSTDNPRRCALCGRFPVVVVRRVPSALRSPLSTCVVARQSVIVAHYQPRGTSTKQHMKLSGDATRASETVSQRALLTDDDDSSVAIQDVSG